MSEKDDGRKADSKGRLNPLSVTPPGAGPSPTNQPDVREVPTPQSPLDRREVFSGVSVDLAGKPHVGDSDRIAGPKANPFLQEDPNQLSRHLTPDSIPGFQVKKGPITFENSRRNDE